ncbi:hypothetical protein MY04_3187 [Flammeovirga sp. MY04]|uniref:hypothetical protein n=1 Tax=Flammeovirga sp. MY04 TaxID=1191459 RepID=UPI0008061DAE|nr:hypothetical protein [Flammeovirga sp. MY04]ANQ50552.1 hypothetical protein MY04_3187 [Flammeovirga sp. MY04]
MEKVLLLIDDGKDQEKVLDNIKSKLEKDSINLTNIYINPIDREFWNKSRDPDLSILIDKIQHKTRSLKPNLVVVDQYYGDTSFSGLNVISELRKIKKFKKSTFFLISGRRDKIVRDIFEVGSDSSKVTELVKLLGLKIEQFLDKEFKGEAINILKKDNIDEILPQKLRSHEKGNITIHQFSPKYRSLTFEELADKIDEGDQEVSSILDELFDMTLSHYANIDEEL